MTNLRVALPIFFSKPVTSRAVKVALIVGIILAFINHGGVILSGSITSECWIKMLLTCFVPYIVSSVTATLNILEQHKL
jgi:uncharacterized membrane protein YqaE (UPF0057 family)